MKNLLWICEFALSLGVREAIRYRTYDKSLKWKLENKKNLTQYFVAISERWNKVLPIVRFTSAAYPKILDFKNPAFFGQKNEVLTTANMWL